MSDSSSSITAVLAQIRSYQGRIDQAGVASTGDVARSNAINGLADSSGSPQAAAPSFSQTLREAIGGVNQTQQNAGALAKAFELGEPGADLAKVMVAAQQSTVAFRATVEVRNRIVQAYQDVMSMPL